MGTPSRFLSKRMTSRSPSWSDPDAAKLDGGEKLKGCRRLNQFVDAIETQARPDVDFDALLEHEMAISPSLDGRTVLSRAKPDQMRLF